MNLQFKLGWFARRFVLASTVIALACESDETPVQKTVALKAGLADLGTHTLTYVYSESQGEVVIFENGLGDDLNIWFEVMQLVGQDHQVIGYDRGGYSTSQLGPVPRDFVQLMDELHRLISIVANQQQVYLVGHSLGGALIRAYATTYPEQVAGLVFVDASHEEALILTQQQEDDIVSYYSGNIGAAKESEMLIEDMQFLKTIGRLPNVPAVALSSVKGKSVSEAKYWTELHQSMGSGLTYFRQVSTAKSGHHIQTEEPRLVADAVLEVIQ
jgi:pimeloyl-ACP methyl ester carboxylesterase